MYPRPVQVQYLGDYKLAVTFEDGVRADLDFEAMVKRGGAFAALSNVEVFAAVRLDPEAETLVWPTGADVCPDVLYHLATGAALPGDLPHPPARLINLSRPALRRSATA